MAGTSVTQLSVLIEKSPFLRVTLGSFKSSRGDRLVGIDVGVGGIDKYSTKVFLEKILRYYYIPTTGVADSQAPLNNMLQCS